MPQFSNWKSNPRFIGYFQCPFLYEFLWFTSGLAIEMPLDCGIYQSFKPDVEDTVCLDSSQIPATNLHMKISHILFESVAKAGEGHAYNMCALVQLQWPRKVIDFLTLRSWAVVFNRVNYFLWHYITHMSSLLKGTLKYTSKNPKRTSELAFNPLNSTEVQINAYCVHLYAKLLSSFEILSLFYPSLCCYRKKQTSYWSTFSIDFRDNYLFLLFKASSQENGGEGYVYP